jgi:hypothetical protein
MIAWGKAPVKGFGEEFYWNFKKDIFCPNTQKSGIFILQKGCGFKTSNPACCCLTFHRILAIIQIEKALRQAVSPLSRTAEQSSNRHRAGWRFIFLL